MHGLYNAWLDIRNDHRVVEIRPSQVGRKTENPRVKFCQSAKNDRTGGVLAAESHTFHVVAFRLL